MKSFLAIFVRYLAAFVVCFSFVSGAIAQGEDGNGPGSSSPTIPEVNALAHQEVEQRLRVYGNDMMGDQIDPATGSIIFNQTDISIPGNFNLPVAISRKLTGESLQAEASSFFANWTLDVPRITQIVQTYVDGEESLGLYQWADRCTAPTERQSFSLNYAAFTWDQISDGMSVNLPGKSSGRILDDPDPNVWGEQSVPNKSTTAHLHISCISDIGTQNGGGEGFIAITPDGTTYRFDKLHYVPTRPVASKGFRLDGTPGHSDVKLQRKLAVVYATQVTDVHGNTVNYVYDSAGRLTEISASDGRQISLTYDANESSNIDVNAIPGFNGGFDPNTSHLITSATAHGRTWTYEYGAADFTDGSSMAKKTLKRVIQPDGKAWEYDLDDLRSGVLSLGIGECENPALFQRTLSITHPYGASGEFKLDRVRHGKTNVPHTILGDNAQTGEGCNVENHYVYKPWFNTISVMEKRLSGPSMLDEVWTYEYPATGINGVSTYTIRAAGNQDIPEGDFDIKKTIVTDPIGNQIEYYHNRRWGPKSGQLAKTIKKNAAGNILETTENQYVINETLFGVDYFVPSAADQAANAVSSYMTQSVTSRDGDTFTNTSTYNVEGTSPLYSYGNPLTQSVASNISPTRTTAIEYEHLTGSWILGLPKSVHINERLESSNDIDPATGQVMQNYRYGEPYAAFEYHDDGTIHTIRDANMIADQALSPYTANSWKRGIVETVTRPDGTSTSQTINDFGWVTSSQTARGVAEDYKTEYEYDEMGRLTKLIPPKIEAQWDDTVIDYVFGDEVSQTITKGQAKTTVTYDNKFRPLLEKTEDTSGTGWLSYVNTVYDAAGQVTFKSQPSSSATESNGTDFTYDGLGRQLTTKKTVAPFAETLTEYLSSHATRITDAEGHQTTTYKNGFDEVIKIAQPEGTTTEIFRDGWGQITKVEQFDAANSAIKKAQHYRYDSQQRLCRHHTPSGVSSLFAYDAAGYLIQLSKGNSWAGGCADPNGNTLANYSYDAMGRLKTTNYADSDTPDINRYYDEDGNLEVLIREDADRPEEVEWYQDPMFSQWTYGYDELGNLTFEDLFLDWQPFKNDYVYNPDGSLYSATRAYRNAFWPEDEDGYVHTTVFDRDGLGRGIGVALDGDGVNLPDNGQTLLSGASFFPSGTVQGFDYGNGQSFTQTLNARLMPDHLTSVKSGGATALDLTFTYTARGLVNAMTDGVDMANNRAYGYDGQGRLTSADGPWGGDGKASFQYDALGNILSKTLGDRQIDLTYNTTNNRLIKSTDSGETGTRALTYDSRGNVKSIGGVNMSYDASDRPTGLSGDVDGSYRYDGNGRRVKSITAHDDGTTTTRYNVYDASGALVYVVQWAPGTENDSVTNYVKLDGQTIARVKSTGPYSAYSDEVTYLHHDHLGSAVAGTDENGDVLWTEKYTPYGISLVNDAANDNQAGFTGHIKDTDTGLTYMQARYYDPVVGRFLSHDPEGFLSQGLDPDYFNRYMYTANNPVNAIDPDGRKIVVKGSPEYKAATYANIAKLYENGMEGRLKQLEYSDNDHTIRQPTFKESIKGLNNTNTPIVDPSKGQKVEDDYNGKGLGSLTLIKDPTAEVTLTNSDGTKTEYSPESVLAHELTSHGYDTDRGETELLRNTQTGEPKYEEDAKGVANEYRQNVGEKERE